MENCTEATQEELMEWERKCDNCEVTARFKAWHWGRYCKEHFITNANYDTEEWVESALDKCEIIN